MKITVAAAGSSPRPSNGGRCVPRPTALAEVCNLLGGDRFPHCESRSLRLEKFVRIGGNSKREEIDAVVKCQSRLARPMPLPAGAVQFPATLKSRLIVNQAGGILENAGLCLHPHFGYPYVPGSAVKGVARHAAWCEWNTETDEGKKADVARRIAVVFGYPTTDNGLDRHLAERGCDERRCGAVSFFAAEPENGKAPLVTDIVNCHHPKYYAGGQPGATDDEQPNPQFFPAVEAGATFVFTIAPVSRAGLGGGARRPALPTGACSAESAWRPALPEGDSSTQSAGRDVPVAPHVAAALADAKRWLKAALTENGIGAKTSAGYGWFSVGTDTDDAEWNGKREAQERAAADARRKKAEQSELHCLVMSLAGMDEKAPEFSALLRSLERRSDDMDELDKTEFNRQKKREPELSPKEKVRREWDGKTDVQCATGRFIREFQKLDEVTKATVVSVLRTHPLWTYLKTRNFKDIKKKQHMSDVRRAVDSICAFAKTTPEGKMP